MINLIAAQPWYFVALQIYGAIMLGLPLFVSIYNKGRKQANVTISKTEAERYKNMIENKLAELNITDLIERKVAEEIKPLKDMLWNREVEHYETKKEIQERLIRTLDEKAVVERENELLHNEIGIIRKEHDQLQLQFNSLKKEVEILKQNTNGK